MILNDFKVKVPELYIEHIYKKEYGLTTEQFLNEPIDRITFLLKIKELEGIRNKLEDKKHGKT